ncbi:MAG: SGNH/GDSL hydrolase family protein [Planctomycetaceae bacterium]
MSTRAISVHAAEITSEQLQLTLPPTIYAVPETEIGIYYQNTVLYEPASDLTFRIQCDVGKDAGDHWSLHPLADQAGDYPLKLSVMDPDGNEIARATSRVKVAPQAAGSDQPVRILIIGDSLTHHSGYPNQLSKLCSQPENPTLIFLGTHHPEGALPHVSHEGYGGWTWNTFLERYIAPDKSDGTYKTRSSPFVRLNEEGKPTLDVQGYLNEHCNGVPPDVVVFKLGINDCFTADTGNPDVRITAMLEAADQLLAEFRQAAPQALFGLCLTTPGNSREAAFSANYAERYSRRGWKQIQHRLVQRQIEHFREKENEYLSIIPTELNLDTTGGYPDNNAVHPNTEGYNQIGTSIYAWLKSHLEK